MRRFDTSDHAHHEDRTEVPGDVKPGEVKSHAAEEPHHHEFHGTPHESPWVVTLPLILLAIPSVVIGALTIGPMLYGGWFGDAIAPSATMAALAKEWHGWWPMILHAFTTLPLYLALGGVATAWFLYIKRPDLPAVIKQKLGVIPVIL